MKINLECLYCGHKWHEYWSRPTEGVCGKCGDKEVKVRKEDYSKDPFGYNYDGARDDAYIKKKRE